jgi:hypothetical protein
VLDKVKVRASLGTLVAQLFFIAAGVYLGNRADDWKQNHEHRQAARQTLVNFRAELASNRASLVRVAPYHAELARGFAALTGGPGGPPTSIPAMFKRVGWRGAGEVAFRRTAWDLALANQSLGYLDQDLAFAVADVYLHQQRYEAYQETMQRAVYTPASLRPEAVGGVTFILMMYFSDVSRSSDPNLAKAYDRVLSRVDSAIRRPPR